MFVSEGDMTAPFKPGNKLTILVLGLISVPVTRLQTGGTQGVPEG